MCTGMADRNRRERWQAARQERDDEVRNWLLTSGQIPMALLFLAAAVVFVLVLVLG